LRTLDKLLPDERGRIEEVSGNGTLRQRLLDMGVVPGAEIRVMRVAPLGDPVEYMVRGYRLSLRRTEAANVLVEDLPCQDCPKRRRACRGRRRFRCRRWLRWLDRSEGHGQ